jgi:hypothetical protein
MATSARTASLSVAKARLNALIAAKRIFQATPNVDEISTF